MADNHSLQIAFIGLGIMGRPMARNLLGAGYPLTVWNRSRPGIDALVAEGAREGGSARAAAEQADIVITMVPDSPDVEQVALGSRGIIEAARPGLVHIDMSTISPMTARHVAEELRNVGVATLDAPVSGGEQGAINGTLSIMIGGEEAVFGSCRPVLEVLGEKLVYCGPSGSGQVVKLCNQIAVALNNLGVCEAITLCRRTGVEPQRMLEALGASAGNSWQLQNLAPKMLAQDWRPGFKLAHQAKDLRHALEAARESGASLPGTVITHLLFAPLAEDELGGEGTQALLKTIERLGGDTSVQEAR